MGRPRKNPDDPKWKEPVFATGIKIRQPRAYDWNLFFAAALGGLIAKGGLQHDQMIKIASQIATEAQDSLS